MDLIFNSRIYFVKIPLDQWIRFDSIPVYMFINVFDYIDQPALRPMIDIYINADYTEFMKVWKYGRDIT